MKAEPLFSYGYIAEKDDPAADIRRGDMFLWEMEAGGAQTLCQVREWPRADAIRALVASGAVRPTGARRAQMELVK